MTICACRFDGDLTSKAHRDHHRAWEASQPAPPVPLTPDEVLALLVRLDGFEARLVTLERAAEIIPLPPTPGAQAILARAARARQ